jgi:hypothetical protein
MNYNDRVFAGFDDLIKVTDSTSTDGCCQWAVVPNGLFSLKQKTPDKIGR